MKGKALRRALATGDAIRINTNLPLITDKTELITPQYAHEILKHNKSNRPIDWTTVEKYAEIMRAGRWALHAQGIVIGSDGNLLTGQTRLWGVIYADVAVYMRVSRGNPPDVGKLLDRGRPQSARDLAARDTEVKHSPTEASIARGMCALNGNMRPSKDELALVIASNVSLASAVLAELRGTKKTKSIIMVLAAICSVKGISSEQAKDLARRVDRLAERLDLALLPTIADKCWGKGAAFGLALEHARKCVDECRDPDRK